ncbi:MAG: SRPBCC domain-containing protein [Vicinamibacterales bacterium]|jgi:uncharacterized protein YndB with AHSA1/START domain|nr:hypothetical protein [Acidobacteriota bacterium]MDP7294750.1 SRPBCC domain-containing protein [Vicinamibacterales bacterium]MDP7471875.1 SRPBCC domain-containing protein [Vicinamibacterales bacterium]MDP7671531.1 SRPBCC domain-containing protein [Vicinamibacterales bacterium]HJO39462.1 SRPBCC domain-containing protein [Vicinamibacterales bacterium]|tara:strand:- start:756 stop:1352 length:597 start_codon:yes stop_codon:yes gene_type:complete
MSTSEEFSTTHEELITAAPDRVLAAFFDPAALSTWWLTTRSVTVAQPLGVYAVEWEPTPFRDEVLGPLGGAFHGTVMEHRPEREFFVADAYWLPPEGPPLGPMALEVTCQIEGPATRVQVRQSGHGTGDRWERYYGVIRPGWVTSLRALKSYLEAGPERVAPDTRATDKKPMARIPEISTPARAPGHARAPGRARRRS